jgi:cytochrome P450
MLSKNSPTPVNGTRSLLIADEAAHSRVRRNLSHAFSEKALRGQESIMQSYVDLLVQRLAEHAAEDRNIDIMTWYSKLPPHHFRH